MPGNLGCGGGDGVGVQRLRTKKWKLEYIVNTFFRIHV